MNIIEKKIKGVFEITFTPQNDERGYFMRTYDMKIFEYFGLNKDWVQENHARTDKKNVIRGLHYQHYPFTEAKMIRCTRGAILDVYVDLRKNSPTFGKWESIELSEQSKKSLFLPRGFAHGYCTLSEVSEIIYKVDNFYKKDYESGIIWNDPDLNISWPVKEPILSAKDKGLPTFAEYISKEKILEGEL